MAMTICTHMETPVGRLRLVADAESGCLTAIHFPRQRHVRPDHATDGNLPVLREAARQLAEYFAGERRAFDLPLDPGGTPFQRRVWHELRKIPFGEHRSYSDLARAAGTPAAVRAVGGANARNPLVIVVPCHRVIGKDGSLTGFGAGERVKAWLLEHESRAAARDRNPLQGAADR